MKIERTEWYTTANLAPDGGLWLGYACNVAHMTMQEVLAALDGLKLQEVKSIHLHRMEHTTEFAKRGEPVIQVLGEGYPRHKLERILAESTGAIFPHGRFDDLVDISKPMHWVNAPWLNPEGQPVHGYRLGVRMLSDGKRDEIKRNLTNLEIKFDEIHTIRTTDTLVGNEIVYAVTDPTSIKLLKYFWDMCRIDRHRQGIDEIDHDVGDIYKIFCWKPPVKKLKKSRQKREER